MIGVVTSARRSIARIVIWMLGVVPVGIDRRGNRKHHAYYQHEQQCFLHRITLRFRGQGYQNPLDQDSRGTNPAPHLDPVKNRCRATLQHRPV